MKTELYRIEKYGVCRNLTFVDDGSGNTFNRSGWRGLKYRAQAGDVIVVSYLARFGRDFEKSVAIQHDRPKQRKTLSPGITCALW